MGDWTLQQAVFAAFVGTFSLAAAFCDFRTQRVPNWLTVPMFLLGWAFQGWFTQWDGIAEAAMAFGLGFGVLFVLWLMGSGGGGDVKLVGALSVWLGLRMTILVLIVSTVLVLVGTVLIVAGSAFRRGAGRAPEPALTAGASPLSRRRIMAFAVPVALATWTVIAFELPPLL